MRSRFKDESMLELMPAGQLGTGAVLATAAAHGVDGAPW